MSGDDPIAPDEAAESPEAAAQKWLAEQNYG